ncbi:MAG: gliding motility protein, partial [Myxococcota bacterium]
MAQVNPLTRELLVKLVYYGPGHAGKTTSLQAIHGAAAPESRGQLVSLATPVDRTLYFDFLPQTPREVRGHHVRLQLFTVPGDVRLNATRKLVLTGADGVLFVADSRRDRREENVEALENLRGNLEDLGRELAETPLVFQWNKRDLDDVLGEDELA